MEYYIRKARVQDVKAIHALLMKYAERGALLSRALHELYSHLREFYVISPQENGEITGCCALSITWEDLAEIRSLVVDETMQKQGWGQKLVEACVSEAVTLGLYRVFTLTRVPEFFAGLGFVEVNKDTLPQKVWLDCVKCPMFPECDEIAMLMEM